MIIRDDFLFKVFFLLLPFVYSVLYAPFGFGDHDTGFILGLSWQLMTGSIPYTDIIYVRPPSSYFFHTLPLFLENFGVIVDRSFFYFQVATYSYLTIILLSKSFLFSDNKKYVFFLSSLSFIISVHTFPPMAWHTVDGVFFSIIGIYFILTYNRYYQIFLGVLFLFIGALSKQPFYLIPFLTMGYILSQYDYKKFWILIVSKVMIIIIFLLYIETIGATSEFLSLTTGQTKISDLLSVGFLSYIKSVEYFIFVFLPPVGILLFLSRLNSKIVFYKYFYILFLWILIFSMYAYIQSNSFIMPVKYFPNVLFIASIVIVFYNIFKAREEKYYLLLLLLILSWTASISWGYNTVILFSAPVIFILSRNVQHDFKKASINKFAFIFLLFACLTFYVGYQNPYNLGKPLKKSDLKYKMEEIYPKLKFIYGDKETYIKYKELKSLISEYGNNFTVLPDVTLIHYLSGTNNPIGIDWVMNAEINNQDNIIIDKLETKRLVVIIKNEEIKADGKFGSKVTAYISENWNKIKVGIFFSVYSYGNENE